MVTPPVAPRWSRPRPPGHSGNRSWESTDDSRSPGLPTGPTNDLAVRHAALAHRSFSWFGADLGERLAPIFLAFLSCRPAATSAAYRSWFNSSNRSRSSSFASGLTVNRTPCGVVQWSVVQLQCQRTMARTNRTDHLASTLPLAREAPDTGRNKVKGTSDRPMEVRMERPPLRPIPEETHLHLARSARCRA